MREKPVSRRRAPLTLTNGLKALAGAIEPAPRREEPVVTGSSLTSYPCLATYKVVRNAGRGRFTWRGRFIDAFSSRRLP